VSEAIEVQSQRAVVPSTEDKIATTIQMAIDRGIPPESLAKFLEVQRNMRQDVAEAEFAAALADFRLYCPSIPRDTNVEIPTRSGAPIRFKSASLDGIMEVVGKPLGERGMSIGFKMGINGSVMTAKCILRHRNGATPIESEFPITTNNPNPGMSEQHKWVGAQTFAKRYALINVLGLPLVDPDPENEGDPTVVTAEQAANLTALLDETKSNAAKFLEVYGVKSVSELRQNNYAAAVGMLERKRKAVTR